MGNFVKKSYPLMGCLVVLVFYQNCGPGFERAVTDQSSFGSLEEEASLVEGDPVLFSQFQKVMETHCTTCHGSPDSNFGGIADFVKLQSQADWIETPLGLIVPGKALESKIFYRLSFAAGRVSNQNTNMPVANGNVQPTMTQDDAKVIEDYINSIAQRDSILASCEPDYSPGEVEVRRLNASELSQTMSDLFQIPNSFVNLPEVVAGQFSNIGRFQTLDENFFSTFDEEAMRVSQLIATQYIDDYRQCGVNITCYKKALLPLAELMFRTRVTEQDVQLYTRAIENLINHSDFNFTNSEIFQSAVYAMLLSPKFLFLLREGNESGERRYNDFEIATRVSLTLFGATPNADFLDRAKKKDFSERYQQTIDVLLRSSDIDQRIARRFAEGWLGLSKIDSLSPQTSAYGINEVNFRPIGQSLKESVVLSIEHALKENQPVDSLVTGSSRFLDRRLASHYQIPGSFSDDFRLVSLPPNSPYGGSGLLTTSPVVSTSLSDRESIVFRGVEVMGAFTCKIPPPPPDNVDTEIAASDFAEGTSQRIILAEHSSNNSCAACHQSFDPYGFGLESFDGLGRYRTRDQFGNLIDSTGEIDGRRFSNHKEMAQLIVAQESFKNCMSQLFLTFSTGQPLDIKNQKSDLCTSSRIASSLRGDKDNLKSLLREVFLSRYFTHWID